MTLLKVGVSTKSSCEKRMVNAAAGPERPTTPIFRALREPTIYATSSAVRHSPASFPVAQVLAHRVGVHSVANRGAE